MSENITRAVLICTIVGVVGVWLYFGMPGVIFNR